MTYVLETQKTRYIIYMFYQVNLAKKFVDNNKSRILEIVPNNHFLVNRAIQIAGNDERNWPVELDK